MLIIIIIIIIKYASGLGVSEIIVILMINALLRITTIFSVYHTCIYCHAISRSVIAKVFIARSSSCILRAVGAIGLETDLALTTLVSTALTITGNWC